MSEAPWDRLLVASVDPAVGISKTNCAVDLKSLPDPHNGLDRTYLVSNNKGIAEIQAIAAEHASFLVGSYVLNDGKLYTITPVDPLYWFLAASGEGAAAAKSWQPLEQLVSEIPVRQKLDQEQLVTHMLDSMEISDDEIFYKFSSKKALAWLARRQNRVRAVLEAHMLRDAQEKRSLASGSAFSETFSRGEADAVSKKSEAASSPQSVVVAANASATPKLDEKSLTLARNDSVQAVCQYLNEEWRNRFLEFLNLESTVLEPVRKTASSSKPSIAVAVDWNADLVSGSGASSTMAASKEAAKSQTVGVKRLAKVNTKGMKKMSSFFGAKKAKSS